MKVSVILAPITAFAALGFTLLIAPKILGQAIAPVQLTTGVTAEMERVIVTGSNIPPAEEVGPNPVDTYRPEDIRKLGARNPSDLVERLPIVYGTGNNDNGNGIAVLDINLRGIFKETLVLLDGRRLAAYAW